jgi:hypothetical protein
MAKAFEHFKTITRHRHQVIRNCFKAGIPWQGLRHDLSKYSPTEFLEGARYWQGTRSPNDREREVKGYSDSWMHHKGRNRHHFEYWTDYSAKDKKIRPVEMPTRYVVEMFCDRVAASKIYQGKAYTDQSPLTYFINGKGRREGMIHPATSDKIEDYLTYLAENGEDKAFTYLREIIKKDKKERKERKKALKNAR